MDPTVNEGHQVGRLAQRLVAAERAVGARRARDVSRPWIIAGRLADIVAVAALLMPWGGDDHFALRGYRLSPQLTTCVLLALVLRQIVLTVALARPDVRSRKAIVAIHLGGLVGIAVGVPAISPGATHLVLSDAGTRPASLVFLIALVAGTLAGVRAGERINDALTGVDLLDGLQRPTAAAVEESLTAALDDAHAAPGATVELDGHQPPAAELVAAGVHTGHVPHTGWAAPNRPRIRLGRATLGLAVIALLCTRLAWVLRPDRTDTFVLAGLDDGLPSTVLGFVTLLAAARLAVVVGRPERNAVVTGTALVVTLLAAATAVSALVELGSARVNAAPGPAGWLTLVVFSGVASLALFTASAVYESWREYRRGSPELALAGARLEPTLRPHRMW